MTYTASLAAPERDAFRLVEAIDGDPALVHLAVDAIEEGRGRWRVTLYLDHAPEKELGARLEETARTVLGDTARFMWSALPDTDWVAKSLAGLPPVLAGRFLVHGSHDRAQRTPNDIAIEIEAGEAFGTGHHGTTAGCLFAIERTLRARRIRNALDIGTGSGVLAIAIAKFARVPVLASDIDPVAVRVATANVRLNGVAPLVRVVHATGIVGRPFRAAGPFDLIVANILAGPLVGLAPAIRRALASSGTVILSGLIAEQRNRVASAYRAQGLVLVRATVLDDWATLVLDRPTRRTSGKRASRVAVSPARGESPVRERDKHAKVPSFGRLLARSPLEESDLRARKPARAFNLPPPAAG